MVEIQSFEPLKKKTMILLKKRINWVMNTNEASNKNGAGIGVVVENSSSID